MRALFVEKSAEPLDTCHVSRVTCQIATIQNWLNCCYGTPDLVGYGGLARCVAPERMGR